MKRHLGYIDLRSDEIHQVIKAKLAIGTGNEDYFPIHLSKKSALNYRNMLRGDFDISGQKLFKIVLEEVETENK